MPNYPQAQTYKQMRRDQYPNPAGHVSRLSDGSSNNKPFLSPVTPAVTGLAYPSTDYTNEMLDRPRYTNGTGLAGASSYHHQQQQHHHHNASAASPYNQNRLSSPTLNEAYYENDIPSVDDESDMPADGTLDQIWRRIQAEKTVKMSKEKPKVQSLEEAVYDLGAGYTGHDVGLMKGAGNGDGHGAVYAHHGVQDLTRGIKDQLHIDVPLAASQESPPRPTLTKQKSVYVFFSRVSSPSWSASCFVGEINMLLLELRANRRILFFLFLS